MSENTQLAVMPLKDYQDACNAVREKVTVPETEKVIVDKTFYPTREYFTEKLLDGELVIGEKYTLIYEDFVSNEYTDGYHEGVRIVRMVNVPSVGEVTGMQMKMPHPANEGETYNAYIYQNNMEIMLYVDKHPSSEAHIILTKKTQEIVSSELVTRINDVYDAGKQIENQEFWINFLSGLNQEECRYAMAGGGWNDNSFNPNVSFTAAQGSNLGGFFYYSAIEDLAGILERNNVVWDFSGALNVSNFAYNSHIVNFPLLDISDATDITRAFYGLKGDNITLPIRLNDDGSQVFSSTFNGSTGIVNLTIYGTIGQNGFNVSPCINLSKDSWISIINTLSSTTTGLSITGSLASVQKAFETVEGANDGDTSPEWLALKATKSNWGVSLL